MFVGHYAPALLIRSRERSVPLWALFLAVQAVDIAFFVLVPLGVEELAIDPARPGFLALRLTHMPWHWVCDLLVHTPDLPIAPGAPMVGLGLWRHRELAFAIEIALLLVAFLILMPHLRPRARTVGATVIGLLIVVQTLSTFVIPLPGSTAELAITSEASFFAFAALAAWIDRSDSSDPKRG